MFGKCGYLGSKGIYGRKVMRTPLGDSLNPRKYQKAHCGVSTGIYPEGSLIFQHGGVRDRRTRVTREWHGVKAIVRLGMKSRYHDTSKVAEH